MGMAIYARSGNCVRQLREAHSTSRYMFTLTYFLWISGCLFPYPLPMGVTEDVYTEHLRVLGVSRFYVEKKLWPEAAHSQVPCGFIKKGQQMLVNL